MNTIVRPGTAFQGPRQRRPRVKVPNHLAFIRSLPCIICCIGGPGVEAAHIRMSDRRAAKRETGCQEKPSDCWTVPMCAYHHRTGPDAQHSMSERDFWDGPPAIDVIIVAAFLFAASGDHERGCQIIRANGLKVEP